MNNSVSIPQAQELRLLVRPGRGRRPYYRPQMPPRPAPGLNRRNVYSGNRQATRGSVKNF